MESSFSSPRTDAFPAGLRVLVVDDDPTWVKILEKMLKKCSYEVTTCCLARDALDLLRERKDGFDIVISDVNMPDMDGFKLLEHVGLEMDLPVIMMSVDGETSRVMKGVHHGACDYLLKPIRMKELRNIWQHVFRKRIHEVRDIESQEGIDEIQMMRNVLDHSDDMYLLNGVDPISGKKRKDAESKNEDKDFGDSSSAKKARVVWTVDLHQKFVKAVNQIGFDKVGPKKILDLMNVPWLTRENVASHLQKYRLYLSRLQKDNGLKASFGGIRHSDASPVDPSGSLALHNSVNLQQHDAVSVNYAFSGRKIHAQNADTKIHEGDAKGIASLPTKEKPSKALISNIPDPQRPPFCSTGGLNHSLGSLEQHVNFAAFGPTNKPFSWGGEIPEIIQYKQEHKKHPPLPIPQHHVQVDCLQPGPSINSGPFSAERDKPAPIEIKHSKYRTNQIRHVASVSGANDLFSILSESNLTDFSSSESITTTSVKMKNQSLNQTLVSDYESAQKRLILGSGPTFVESRPCLVQADYCTMYSGMQNKEVFDYNPSELLAEVPAQLYDSLRFDYEYPSDLMDYPVIDQGLFIA